MDNQLKRYYTAVILMALLLVAGLWLVVWQQVEYERNKIVQ